MPSRKVLLLSLCMTLTLLAVDIPTEHAKKRSFTKSVELNAKIIQLSNAKQSIMSLVSGHIEKYYVGLGEKVKVGQKIALIESIMLSKMTAEYISLKEQYNAVNKNYEVTKKLYEKGMTSMQELNLQSIQKNAMLAQKTALKSQLQTLGVDADSLKAASANYILYAHSEGTVSALLQPLHSVIGEDTSIISIVKNQAYYIKSYLPLEYAGVVKLGQKIVMNYANRNIVSHITQIMPELDETTQRIVLLSSVDENVDNLYINSYVSSTLYFGNKEKYVAIKKSALSFFNNEWVVFIPTKQEHDDLGGHEEHDDLGQHKEHSDEHAGHEGHGDEHDEEGELPYEVRVIEVIIQDEEYVGVNGLEEGEEYVSAKSYYAKSMILKSSLGGHGH
ncbi:MAG: efflux RND transporter periplasmic adaptor subunit [Sulfurimonas sp.]|nr:efflux RND transporter periplasmic adaptor subunit [Sulfurimonas sp.]